MSTSVRKEYAHLKDWKYNKVAIFKAIVLIQVACSSLPCTLSLYNADSQRKSLPKPNWSEANECTQSHTRTKKGTMEGRNRSRGLLNYIYIYIQLYIVLHCCRPYFRTVEGSQVHQRLTVVLWFVFDRRQSAVFTEQNRQHNIKKQGNPTRIPIIIFRLFDSSSDDE